MKPLVSVIMPAYNAQKYISEAIQSIISQTYTKWELIIVDDGSVDSTVDVIKTFEDSRIKLFLNEQNRGIAETTNRAIGESKGKYIALLDDDDIAEEDRLNWQVKFLENHENIDILGGRTTYIDVNGNVLNYGGIPRNNPKYIKSTLLFQCMDFMNSTAMIRRSFIEKNNLKYQNDCYGMQDYLFYIQSSKLGNISAIDKYLLRHRLHDNNTTKINIEKFAEERAKKYAEFRKYSLQKSGFQLSERELNIINRAFPETGAKCKSRREFEETYKVFKEIMHQAKEMNVDYYDELEHVCKTKLSKLILKFDVFEV